MPEESPQDRARRELDHAERVRRERAGHREDPLEGRRRAARESGLAAMAENRMREAIDRGDFENLPGAGKPLPGVDGRRDLDWWLRRRMETEQVRGAGPPALALRVEDAEMDARLDALDREASVRAVLESFNARVVEARRQLLGGPPVVTETRDVEAEVAAWRQRRERRRAQEDQLARVLPGDAARRGRFLRYWRRRSSRGSDDGSGRGR